MNKQYLMYALSQLMKRRENGDIFTVDETGSIWHRESDIEILKTFCREGYGMAKKHGHFIIGNSWGKSYIGIPGRFLLEDQPAGGKTGFTLWQPLKGGEEMYGNLETINSDTATMVYGYWIAQVDEKTLKIYEP
ncbi:MAG: hypothetical protein KHY62_01695 [Firmicutes bacterium]|nr:hypothetical protein [Bacillota bacterium]